MNIWLTEIWRAWRASVRRPGFALLAVAVLALGVGASTAVFTLVDHLLLQPLPFAQPDRLVVVGADTGANKVTVTAFEYRHLQGLKGVVSTGVMASPYPINALGNGIPAQVPALHIDNRALPTLGVRPVLGRNFTAQEYQPHGPPAAILGYGYWQRVYRGDTHVIGKTLKVNGVPHTIVGVLPASFDRFCKQFLQPCGIALPATTVANTHMFSTMPYLALVRLAPGVTPDSVAAQVQARMQTLAAKNPRMIDKNTRFVATPLASALHMQAASRMRLFAICAFFILLIAWVNLTNLLFLRGLARARDGAIRTALGASALRSGLPAYAESLLIGIAGALVGVGLAAVGITVLTRFLPNDAMYSVALRLNAASWVFALVVAVAAALVATWLGLWRGRRHDISAQLHEGGRSGVGARLGYFNRGLVVAQITLATALLVTAGLFLHTLVRAANVPLGFSPQGVLTFQMVPVKATYPDPKTILALTQRIRDRLGAVPGVTHVDVSMGLPPAAPFDFPGISLPGGQMFAAGINAVDPGYFKALQVSVLKGRPFTRSDVRGGEPVAVVNREFARQHFQGRALGKTVNLNYVGPKPVAMRVVGVVGNVRQSGPLKPAGPMVYLPWQQSPRALIASRVVFAVHVRGNPLDYRDAVHAAMAEVAPLQPIGQLQSMQELVSNATFRVRLFLLLVGVFAVLALVLAATGVYAVMAAVVRAREHEFGVRMALGASPGRLARLILRSGLVQVAIGLVLGIGVAVLLSRLLHAFLVKLANHALDPVAIIAVCVVLAIAGLLACLVPAWRAGRVQPMHALRGE